MSILSLSLLEREREREREREKERERDSWLLYFNLFLFYVYIYMSFFVCSSGLFKCISLWVQWIGLGYRAYPGLLTFIRCWANMTIVSKLKISVLCSFFASTPITMYRSYCTCKTTNTNKHNNIICNSIR